MTNKFCGPFVLSHLAEIPIKDACAILRDITGKKAVKGVFSKDLIHALEKYEITASPILEGPRTLFWFSELVRCSSETFLVNITNHYVVVSGRWIYDNRHPAGVWSERHPDRRRRVVAAWSVRKKNEFESDKKDIQS